MTWRQFVLETRWTFDHQNTEFCTFADEGNYGNLADLFDPVYPDDKKAAMMKDVMDICAIQNGNIMDLNNCKPIALYLVAGPNRPYEGTGFPWMSELPSGDKLLSFELKLIGKFDKDGKPESKPRSHIVIPVAQDEGPARPGLYET